MALEFLLPARVATLSGLLDSVTYSVFCFAADLCLTTTSHRLLHHSSQVLANARHPYFSDTSASALSDVIGNHALTALLTRAGGTIRIGTILPDTEGSFLRV